MNTGSWYSTIISDLLFGQYIKEEKMKIFNKFNQQYKYYFQTKPYSFQPYPDGYEPIDVVYFDMPKIIKGSNTMAYGYIIFDRKLDGWNCLKYDLYDFNT